MLMSVLMFLFGIHMMITMLAACYRIVDLWYRIGDFWAGIFARILGLSLVIGVLIEFLPPDLQIAFVRGMGFYLAFHLVVFWIARIAIWQLESRSR